ncbi:Asp-tRNA(Asn)/Glu-tRNA(Gln) amidotransferase subunit GatA [Candidatus Woesebacteria bacterium]|nr:Asp-tRNA(Asn)/Glu-tRNA(Gln) amidotransferase subunit GatA [Candidatus Woesebacteria bacterium]
MNTPQTISELHDDLRQNKYTVVSLVEEYLKKITEKNPELNAFITVSDEYAYAQAKEADRVIADNPHAFEEFPLLGVVIALKDLYLTKGIRTTAASKLLSDYVPAYSATVVERLEKAGAIIIGKTNCDAWAHGASGENSDFGASLNPWNTEYVPGGSSSGSAVSVAAGMSLASMGTDTGGSIRQPASFTNLVGFKPTYGAVPRYGVIAMASSLDTMGHFTHTVEDSAKIFAVTNGQDQKDSTIASSQNAHQAQKPFRIGVPKEYFAEGIDPEVSQKVHEVISFYKAQGCEIVDISLPHTKYAISVYYIVQPAEVSSNLGRYDGVRFGTKRNMFGAEAKRRIMLGTYVLASGYYDAYYNKAMKVRTKICEDFSNAFGQVDAILSPVSPTPPFKLGQKASDPLAMYLADIYTVAANLAGLPGLAIPAGFSGEGLPIGFQLLANHHQEDLLFKLGIMYQNETDWHTKLPGRS